MKRDLESESNYIANLYLNEEAYEKFKLPTDDFSFPQNFENVTNESDSICKEVIKETSSINEKDINIFFKHIIPLRMKEKKSTLNQNNNSSMNNNMNSNDCNKSTINKQEKLIVENALSYNIIGNCKYQSKPQKNNQSSVCSMINTNNNLNQIISTSTSSEVNLGNETNQGLLTSPKQSTKASSDRTKTTFKIKSNISFKADLYCLKGILYNDFNKIEKTRSSSLNEENLSEIKDFMMDIIQAYKENDYLFSFLSKKIKNN